MTEADSAPSPEDEIAAMVARFEGKTPDPKASLKSALAEFDRVTKRINELHCDAERSADYGDYVDVAKIGARLVALWNPELEPPRWNGSDRMSVSEALDHLGQCRESLLDRESPRYWEWRHRQYGSPPGQVFLESHLKDMSGTWEIQADPPSLAATSRAITVALHEFRCFHDHWAVPRRARRIDYLPVAKHLHRIAADALPFRPEKPSGRYSVHNLQGYCDELIELITNPISPPAEQPSRTVGTTEQGRSEQVAESTKSSFPEGPWSARPLAQRRELIKAVLREAGKRLSLRAIERALRQQGVQLKPRDTYKTLVKMFDGGELTCDKNRRVHLFGLGEAAP